MKTLTSAFFSDFQIKMNAKAHRRTVVMKTLHAKIQWAHISVSVKKGFTETVKQAALL